MELVLRYTSFVSWVTHRHVSMDSKSCARFSVVYNFHIYKPKRITLLDDMEWQYYAWRKDNQGRPLGWPYWLADGVSEEFRSRGHLFTGHDLWRNQSKDWIHDTNALFFFSAIFDAKCFRHSNERCYPKFAFIGSLRSQTEEISHIKFAWFSLKKSVMKVVDKDVTQHKRCSFLFNHPFSNAGENLGVVNGSVIERTLTQTSFWFQKKEGVNIKWGPEWVPKVCGDIHTLADKNNGVTKEEIWMSLCCLA